MYLLLTTPYKIVMREISIEEYKEKLLIVLDEIDLFCRNHQIEYYLDSGTLIGAIRHNGYIPWDDDIDLIMPREDYEVFIRNYKMPKSSVLSFHNNKSYYYQYAKVSLNNTKVEELSVPEIEGLGINIDIFPMDGMPDMLLFRRIHQDRLMLLSKTRAFALLLKRKAPDFLKPLIAWKWIVIHLDKVAKKYSPKKTRYCGNIVATTLRHKEIPRECFNNTIFHVFEGKSYPIPGGYDLYLTLLYGDYMELPPAEKRCTRHTIKAYISEGNE